MKQQNCEQIYVLMWHKWAGSYELVLHHWIKYGPQEPYMLERPGGVKCGDGRKLSISVIPLRYRNTWFSRLLIHWNILPEPWVDYKLRLARFYEKVAQSRKDRTKRK